MTAAAQKSDPGKATTQVARLRLVDQTEAIPETTVFTPEAEGEFRISGYLTTEPTAQDGDIRVDVDWTDDFRGPIPGRPARFSAPGSFGPLPNPSTSYVTFTLLARVKAGTPITVSVPLKTGTVEEQTLLRQEQRRRRASDPPPEPRRREAGELSLMRYSLFVTVEAIN